MVKTDGLISVIVPIYKVEDYLNRCVESILNQTYENFELILVDDGSPDNCGQICDIYAEQDSRIHVVHKENGGLSDARNTGLKVCCGKYIVFIDSDDWISKYYLEKLYDVLQSTESDIVECEIIRTDKFHIEDRSLPEIQYTEYTAEEAIDLLIQDKQLHQHVWNKLYKRSVIADIWFEKGKTNEDEFWTYQVFGKAKKITKFNLGLYYYYQRTSSIMGVGFNIKRLDAIEAKVERQKYLETYYPSLSIKGKINLFFSCMYAGQMSMIHLTENEIDKAFCFFRSIIKQNSDISLIRNISRFKDKIWFTLGILNFKKTCQIRNFFKIGF